MKQLKLLIKNKIGTCLIWFFGNKGSETAPLKSQKPMSTDYPYENLDYNGVLNHLNKNARKQYIK
jgi:hypothetical protein